MYSFAYVFFDVEEEKDQSHFEYKTYKNIPESQINLKQTF